MGISKWEKMPSGDFLLRGALPGVRSNARRVQLDQSGTTLHIQAARPVPARGRRCLPSSAKISPDGRFEVYEASVALPPATDGARGTVQQTSNGFEVLVPRSPSAKHRSPIVADLEQGTQMKPIQESILGDEQLRSPSLRRDVTQDFAKTRVNPSPKPETVPEIPEGVEVVDVEPEEPLKNTDASEGWYDNRGDFQQY
jgi:hypothetical protein